MKALLSLLMVVALLLPSAPARADETAIVAEPGDAPPAHETVSEQKWLQELKDARKSQSRMTTTGIIGSFAAIGLIVAGTVRTNSSEDIEGCERDGSKVRCITPSARDQAQDRIDQGQGIMAAGLVTGLVGLGFLIGGAQKGKKVDELERTGRRLGYKMSFAPEGKDGVQVIISRAF